MKQEQSSFLNHIPLSGQVLDHLELIYNVIYFIGMNMYPTFRTSELWINKQFCSWSWVIVCAIRDHRPMLKEEHISSQVLDHLGPLASVIDKIELVEKIDHRLLVSSRHGAKVTMGQRLDSIVLNLRTKPLYSKWVQQLRKSWLFEPIL